MISSDKSMHALQRFGLGARPGDLSRVRDDPVGALLAESIRMFLLSPGPGLLSTPQAIGMLEEYTVERRKRLAAEPEPVENGAAMSVPPRRRNGMKNSESEKSAAFGNPQTIYRDEVATRYEAAQKADCGFA